MAWEHLSITKPHLVYIILGGFTSLFMLCSSVIKERLYIGEATVATLCGLIFGPHAANLIDPQSWGNVDIVTIEFSRIVLVVQCFAIGVELPKFYMERHWKSVVFLLLPVMTFGWLVTSVIVWWLIEPLSWLESLVVAACVTATDPVLASSVVGKGKFAKRVPKHLRDLLSAESGCNDGMAFPFTYLSLYLIQDHLDAREVTFHWFVYTILYECVFGTIYGFAIGYFARHGIKYAEKRDLIDRESFLVFYFVLALFCAGSGSILGVDDLLVGFAAGVGFSNDGWFGQKTEESHVSNVIDLLLNLTYFVFLGTIIPWEMFNNAEMGLSAWRLTVMAIFVILFRRIPIMMALKPLIPDIKTWREALFAGHFGPIGVGAIFIAILARAELESESPVPLSELPPPGSPHYTLITLVWPVVSFIVIASILVHGSSIAVFTLGKHINTLTLTMSYTTAPEDGPSWMNRLPRITSQSRSQARTMSDTEADDAKLPDMPPGTLPPIGYPGQFLRRVRDEDREGHAKHGSRASSAAARRRRKMWDDGIGPGGPISQSAIFPQRRAQEEGEAGMTAQETPGQSPTGSEPGLQGLGADESGLEKPSHNLEPPEVQQPWQDDGSRTGKEQPVNLRLYAEGGHVIVENTDGDVLAVSDLNNESGVTSSEAKPAAHSSVWTYDYVKRRLGSWRDEEIQKRSREKEQTQQRHKPARAYQFGNTIIVEDEDGEVVKKYELPSHKSEKDGGDLVSQGLKYIGIGSLGKGNAGTAVEAGSSASPGDANRPTAKSIGAPSRPRKKSEAAEPDAEDDKNIRFKIGGVGQRMTEHDFIREMQKLDKSTRREVVDQSSASGTVKALAKQDARQTDRTDPTLVREIDQETDDHRGRAGQTLAHGRRESLSDTTRDREGEDEETAAERRRRMAVLDSVHTDNGGDEAGETPAERRRREAALGIRAQAENAESESEDDDTPRIPPGRRGIRFADAVTR